MNDAELKTRTKQFALRVMRLVGQITAIMVASRKTAKGK
jgi:hypothetical protein